MKTKIIWLTADCFIDVDLPIVPVLAKQYSIDWNVVIGTTPTIDYLPLINKTISHSEVQLKITQLKHRTRNPLLFFEYLKLIIQIKKQAGELYYIDMPGMPYFLPLLRLLIGADKVIIATHNVSTPKGAVNYRVADIYMRFTLKVFKNFHVFSKSQHKVLETRSTSKNILNAPLALKDFGLSKLKPDEKITFLNFGIISDYKRVDVLINAANLAYEKTKIKFIVKIAGKCKNWSKYETQIKYPFLFDLNISSIPNEKVADLFASSHYFVLPYQDIAQSGALTVAFNYGLPVIASNLDSFKELIDDKKTGFLFEAASVEDLTNRMVYILENHATIYPDLQKNQKRFVDEFYAIDTITKKYSDFFENINK